MFYKPEHRPEMLVWSDEVAISRKISFLFLSCEFGENRSFAPAQLHNNNKKKTAKVFFLESTEAERERGEKKIGGGTAAVVVGEGPPLTTRSSGAISSSSNVRATFHVNMQTI